MPLTPPKIWISTATAACFPTRQLYVCLQTEHSFPAARLSSVRFDVILYSAPSHTPSIPIDRRCHLTQPASLLPQTIQTP